MEKEIDSDNILKSSISSASYSMIFQIVFRVISFSINGIFLHNVDKNVLGIINVRLMLLCTTILFISREAFRRACLSNTRNHNWPQVINLIWLTLPNMILWATFFSYIWLNWLSLPSEEILSDYKFAVYMTGLSCIVESFMEPLYLFSQAFLYVRLRLFVDIVILIIRIASLTLTVLFYPKYTLQALAWGSIVCSSGLVLMYAAYFYFQFHKKKLLMKNKELHSGDPLMDLPFDSLLDFLPKRIVGQSFIGYELAQLTWGFFKQGLMKQVLTEGERYIMTIFSVLSFAEQGIYDVVNNLGSLAARFLFLPIEESSYFYFAQMLHRDKPVEEQIKADVQKAAHVLYVLLKGLTLLGLTILVFGFSYSHLLLSLYGGQTLTDGPGPLLLRTHCACVLLLGINGVTEAFVFAAMNNAQLDRHNGAMAAFTFIFLGLSWLLSFLLGGVGFILANCVNMFLRICYSAYFIRNLCRSMEENPLRGLVPSKMQLVAYFVAFLVTVWSERYIYLTSAIMHLFIGAICGASVLATVLFTEVELRSYLAAVVKKKLGRKEE